MPPQVRHFSSSAGRPSRGSTRSLKLFTGCVAPITENWTCHYHTRHSDENFQTAEDHFLEDHTYKFSSTITRLSNRTTSTINRCTLFNHKYYHSDKARITPYGSTKGSSLQPMCSLISIHQYLQCLWHLQGHIEVPQALLTESPTVGAVQG